MELRELAVLPRDTVSFVGIPPCVDGPASLFRLVLSVVYGGHENNCFLYFLFKENIFLININKKETEKNFFFLVFVSKA